MKALTSKSMLGIGVTGFVTAALCCFTPALVILLAAVGVSGALGWLDTLLIPALVGFAGLATYGLWRRRCERFNSKPC